MHSSPLSKLKREFALDEIRGLDYFRSMDWVDSIDSTNKSLMATCRESSLPLPALLVSDAQTSGVGRGDHQWWSPSGCLMFSMAVPVESDLGDGSRQWRTTQSSLLPLRVGVAVAECLEPIATIRPLVKWPNDVYLGGQKVCGILIDTLPAMFGRPPIAIIGVGINCQVNFDGAPEPLRSTATSLHRWARSPSGETTSTESVLVHFMHRWMTCENKQTDAPGWLLDEWSSRSLLDQHWVEIKHASGVLKGRCVGITSAGALRIQDERLQVTEVLAGTVLSFSPLGS